jgi:glycosyltransferase involved in cell wall biosynthesis
LTVVIPGDVETRTGGYGYDRRVIAGLRERGWSVDVLSLEDGFPFPTAAARDHAARSLAAIPDGAIVLVDGLALGVLPDEIGRERERLRVVALVHHPLAAETGLDPGVAAALEESERRALAAVRFVVVTGQGTAAGLAHYSVAPERIAVVEPGTDPAPLARGSGQRSGASAEAFEVGLLCVATLTPRKGHEVLFRALASIRGLPWRLTCAGGLDRDRATVERLRAQLNADGLSDRVDLVGDLDAAQLAVYYDRADVFVLATRYEGYGMAVAEALARGVPVISTATGGIPALVTDEAGIVVAPGDQAAFTAALGRVVGDGALRRQLAQGARRVRDRLPTWADAAAAMERVLDRGPDQTSVSEFRGRSSGVGVPVSESVPGTVPESVPESVSGTVPESVSESVSGTVPESVPESVSGTVPELGFSADWLALREPADRAARSTRLTRKVADTLVQGAELRVLDLGAGTGANLRYLAHRLPEPQSWLLVDRDAALLAAVATRDDGPRRVETRQLDLRAIGDDDAREMFSGRTLVTASALLDLVSEEWMRALGTRCREAAAALLFALSYDGRIQCAPEEPEDAEVRALVNRHQRTDKGFGRALGPDAAAVAETVLVSLGYLVERERSDWQLEPASQELQQQLIDGWARAAAEIAPQRSAAISGWRDRRLAHVAAHRSRLIVGHQDLVAWIG